MPGVGRRGQRRISAAEPVWRPLQDPGSRDIPPSCLDWLADPGSLTRRLVAGCQGGFRVRLLHQGWGRPQPSEARLLQSRGAALIREVELLCNESPQVFARTLIPAASLSGRARLLARLGSRPLGAVLFDDPSTRRVAVEVARLPARCPLFAAATAHLEQLPEFIWGRRTLFLYAGKPLLVNEIFLPGLCGG